MPCPIRTSTRRLPQNDIRKGIAAFAHFPPPTNGFRSTILGRLDRSTIKNYMRTAAFFRDGKSPAPVTNGYGEAPKLQEPESGLLSGSVTPIWLQSATDLRRPRNSLAIAIGYNPFREARRVATIVFTYHACSPIIIPATVVATVPSAMRARTVISANDDGVRVGSRWDGDDGRKSESDSKNDFLHWALPWVIRPRLNACHVYAFHKKSDLRPQSEKTSDHRRSRGHSWQPQKECGE